MLPKASWDSSLSMLTRFANRLHQLLPGACLLCHSSMNNTGKGELICHQCQSDLIQQYPSCRRCGVQTPYSLNNCGQCLKKPPVFDSLTKLAPYQPPYDRLVHKLKYQYRLIYGELLGQLLAQRLLQGGKPEVEAIIPMPLHKYRWFSRGFNQSTEIAMPLAKVLQLRIDEQLCRRKKNTLPQSELNSAQRRKNLAGAFTLTRALPYRHIAIIDDVVTSGATVSSLTRELKNAGAEAVHIWTICRTEKE